MENAPLIESTGCDWLTMTWKASDPRIEDVSGLLYEQIDEMQCPGNEAKFTTMMQYNGVKCGKLFWGRDETHFYLNASSYQAHETAFRLIKNGLGGNATRADLEITAWYPERAKDYFQRLRDRIGEVDLGIRQRNAEKGAYYFELNRDTGISLGGAKADRKLRFYSAREGGHPEHSEHAVRFEGQYRRERAQQIWAMMSGAASIECVSQSVITGEIMALGLKEHWMNCAVGKKLEPISKMHTLDTKLLWYKEQVLPSFVKTINQGHGDTLLSMILEALSDAGSVPCASMRLELEQFTSLFLKKEQNARPIRHYNSQSDRDRSGSPGLEQYLSHQNGRSG